MNSVNAMQQLFNGHQLFDGRTIVIATMHEKEKVMTPPLKAVFNVKCITIPDLNTDAFGTFCGEVERENTPLETVRLKAFKALEWSNESLGIASEGSFGPHPSNPFSSANEELIILVDTKNNLEIVGRYLTLHTNFSHREIKNFKVLELFKKAIGYPEHGIILKITDSNHKKTIYKDFVSSNHLDSIVHTALEAGQNVQAETDMRAMRNPTRMLAIEQATVDLVKNMKSVCPKCKAPGFMVQKVLQGLPCKLCQSPTTAVKADVYGCKRCNYSLVKTREGEIFEDPAYCDFCNP